MKRYIALALILVLTCARAENIAVGLFSRGQLGDWNSKVFDGVTEYRLVTDNGDQVLQATARDSASGLYRELEIDLGQTPVVEWSWKVGNRLTGIDERTRAGDDYPARLYVVFSGGLAFWRTRAINYVWSSTQAAGSEWPNAYTANARMIAVRGRDDAVATWISERRDVRADYRRLFGEEPPAVVAIALMTDTDNSGRYARAWYGDIRFVSR
ncbi:hypothetical protein GCM10011348_05620 [Marinobacterium nitratireducens]|uniref:DUF3047 domain-containing protein n=1 Tax=Marinobacterium nitratireducens TaxID=518897 RepID=A0A917Z8K7_9GAMM|nr:DUF3047 domain-containing protein [Marinobacterium nitratireducens]GGO77016.1 hypothetical protein GCM10011348_05620 [Marinobacterium nitratireducens]